jgi:hypothetical protein
VPLVVSGDAVENVHYRILTPNPAVISAGSQSTTVIVEALDAGIWHDERRAIITVGAPTNAYLLPNADTWAGDDYTHRNAWWLHIRSSQSAPLVDLRFASQSAAYSSPQIITARLNGLSSEDTLVYLQVTGGSTADPADYTLLDDVSGEAKLITILAGSLTGSATLTWTGSAPAGSETVICRVRTGADLGRINEGSFTENLAQHEAEDPIGFSPYAVWPNNYTWSGPNGVDLAQDDNIVAVGSGVADPAGVGEATMLVVGDGDTGVPKVRKSFNGVSVFDVEGGHSVDGYEQTPPFPATGSITCTVYAKKPALASRVSPSWALQLIERSGTLAPRDHLAIFGWSGTTGVLLNTKGLDTADDILSYTVEVQDTAAWAASDTNAVESGWYRFRMTLTPSPVIAGRTSNFMLIPYYPDLGADDETETNKGKGVVFAWPQVELRATASTYQPIRRQFYQPFYGAWLDLAGNYQNTVTVTP